MSIVAVAAAVTWHICSIIQGTAASSALSSTNSAKAPRLSHVAFPRVVGAPNVFIKCSVQTMRLDNQLADLQIVRMKQTHVQPTLRPFNLQHQVHIEVILSMDTQQIQLSDCIHGSLSTSSRLFQSLWWQFKPRGKSLLDFFQLVAITLEQEATQRNHSTTTIRPGWQQQQRKAQERRTRTWNITLLIKK